MHTDALELVGMLVKTCIGFLDFALDLLQLSLHRVNLLRHLCGVIAEKPNSGSDGLCVLILQSGLVKGREEFDVLRR